MTPFAIAGVVALGLAIGCISGLVGLGGGALLIPALVFFYGMSQKTAQGTSLAMMLLPTGLFAFWAYYRAGQVNLKLALWISLGFVIGGWLGGLWAQHLPALVLRRTFAALLIVLALKLAFSR